MTFPHFVHRGDDLYPDRNTLAQVEYKDTEEGVNRMVEDLEKQWVEWQNICG